MTTSPTAKLLELLSRLEEMEKKATKGEWTFTGEEVLSDGKEFQGTDDDGKLLCSSRNALPLLLKIAKDWMAQGKTMKEIRENVNDPHSVFELSVEASRSFDDVLTSFPSQE